MTLRWLPYSEGEAAWNMAVDEALLDSHLQGNSQSTLRFYGWSPPAVSLGYAQRIDDGVVQSIRARGFDVVRRPTGGRAVLHQGDLTYSFVGSSIVAPSRDLLSTPSATNSIAHVDDLKSQITSLSVLPSSVLASYLQICEGLIAGLELLGVQAEIGRGKGAYNRFQDCFQTTTNADLQVDGLKIVGSAQLRRKHAVLQHGSILLNQSQSLMSELLGIQAPSDDAAKRHCNLYEIIAPVLIETLEKALVEGFSKAAGLKFERGFLTDEETRLAQSLVPKYRVANNSTCAI